MALSNNATTRNGSLKKRHRRELELQSENGDAGAGSRTRRRSSRSGKKETSASPSPWVIGVGAILGMTVILLVLLALGIVSFPGHSNSQDVHTVDHYDVVEEDDSPPEDLGTREEQWTEVLSWEPRAYVYHNFLSKEECNYLIKLASPHMEKSTVVDETTGKSTDSRVRTSFGTFLKRGQDKFIKAIEKRIADFTFIPVEHGEGLQVLHYEVGQKYEAHFDYFNDEFNTKNGGQRIATILMYLSDVEEGGETVFPSANVNSSSLPYYNELSECGKSGLAVRPKMGDALLFWSMKPDASLDPSSLHAGCPVIKGNKWSSTKWMRVNEYTAY